MTKRLKLTEPSRSLYRKHLEILGLATQNGTDLATAREQAHINELRLPELRLPDRRRFRHWPVFVAGIAAAALFVIFIQPIKTPSDLTPKGSSKINIYIRTDATTRRLTRDQEAKSGDQIRVEVISGFKGRAFLLFADAAAHLLTTVEQIRQSRTEVIANNAIVFPGSARITGDNVGEVAVVIVCPESSAEPFETAPSSQWESEMAGALAATSDSLTRSGCQVLRKKIR